MVMFYELRYIGKSTLNGSRAPIPSKKFNNLYHLKINLDTPSFYCYTPLRVLVWLVVLIVSHMKHLSVNLEPVSLLTHSLSPPIKPNTPKTSFLSPNV